MTYEPQALLDRDVYGRDGEKIGTSQNVIIDDVRGLPAFLSVSTGFLGMGESIVPLEGAELEGGAIHVPFAKDKVKDAPSVDSDNDQITADDESEILAYYGREMLDGAPAAEPTAATGRRPADGSAMTRSEERLHVSKAREESGRVRLRKYLVTEDVQQTVPVSHEEVRIEHEPITDENRDEALSGERLTEDEHEVTLHADRPVVDKETVPVERVRLDKDIVTGEAQVEGEVTKERIEEERS